MNRTTQLISMHAMGVLFLTLGGGFIVAGWVPPPSPNLSGEEIADVFRVGNADNIRIAAAMMFFGAPFFIPPSVAIH